MNVTPLDGVNEVTPIEFNKVNPINNAINNTIQTNLLFRTDEAFMTDVVKAFRRFGFNLSGSLSTTDNNSSGFANLAVAQALTEFVHSLQATLNQMQTEQTEQTDNDNPVDDNSDPIPPDQQAGFNNFINDLLFLINNNNSGLQSNFDFLMNLLVPDSNQTQIPSLSAFLSMILINLQNELNNQNDVGTSIVTEV